MVIPVLSLLALGYYLISLKQNELRKASAYILAADITRAESKLIHHFQLERDYSIAYHLGSICTSCEEKLKAQYIKTDEAIKNYRYYINLETDEKHDVRKLMQHKNKEKVIAVLKRLELLQSIRESILSFTLDIDVIYAYYTYLNQKLLEQIFSFTTLSYRGHTGPSNIYQVQQLKENESQEGLYIYQYLLDKSQREDIKKDIEKIETREEKFLDEFMANYPMKDKIYYGMIEAIYDEKTESFKERLFADKLDQSHVSEWALLNHQKMGRLEKVLTEVIEAYKSYVESIYQDAGNALKITYFILSISLLSFLFFLFMFRKQLRKESDLLEELRISASSFDAHEAMVISDAQSRIIKVNKAFTRITGYRPEEVIGKCLLDINELKKEAIFYEKLYETLYAKGLWQGELESIFKGRHYTVKASIAVIKNDEGEITHFISQFLDITDLKKAEENAIHQATHDFLTQLPNRKSMMQRVREEYSRAVRHHYMNAFLFIDIDDFKKINDQYGHAIGDKVLIEISRVLRLHIRVEDYVARMSGDEFCIMLLDLDKNEDGAAHSTKIVCEKILAQISYPMMIENQKIQLTGSIGVKFFPNETKDINSIINDADTAMYRAKEMGKNNFVFFNKDLEEKIRYMNNMESEIKKALREKEFIFHFQPKVDTLTEEIVGAELLVRWKHPSGELYYPDKFLHIAKKINIIPQITMEALLTACQFLERYRHHYYGTLSINITAYEFSMEGFVEEVKSLILNHNVDPERIELEIVEDELIEDFDLIISNMLQLKKFGIKFAIDDFGRGYSSISYLQKLPVDTLKIDRCFMEELDRLENKELIKMVINIAKTFHMSCVIEGVENREQLAFIKKYKANQYQGYYFSKPINKEAFIHLLLTSETVRKGSPSSKKEEGDIYKECS